MNGTPGSPPDLVDTTVALHNNRLVALYFSAHWVSVVFMFLFVRILACYDMNVD